jgi:hypothetical protein
MHDPFPSIWQDTIAGLPPVSSVTLSLAPNVDCEPLSCFVCHGVGTLGPEWLVTLRGQGERKIVGLHEACRQRSEVLK